jgi:phage terminase small subunit
MISEQPMARTTKTLTAKQKRFILEYLIDLNATAAYQRAGFKARGHSAENGASRLMRNDEVSAKIARLIELRAQRTQISGDRVLKELARIGFSDLGDVASWGPRGVRIHSERLLLPNIQAAVQLIKESAKGDKTIKMHAKVPALVELGKYLGLYQLPDPS